MKITLLVAAAALLLASAANADSVTVTSVTALTTPSQTLSSTTRVDFTPTQDFIVLKVAGKTCKWSSSTTGSVPQGCNYGITVNNTTMTLSAPTSLNNRFCTKATHMLAACRRAKRL